MWIRKLIVFTLHFSQVYLLTDSQQYIKFQQDRSLWTFLLNGILMNL